MIFVINLRQPASTTFVPDADKRSRRRGKAAHVHWRNYYVSRASQWARL